MGEHDKEITITYETLYELLRREKSREDIQELDPDFVDSVKSYLAEKRSMLYKDAGQQMLFSEEEQKKTLQQITNIIKILRELYDRRERKVINLAVNKSKTDSNMIDNSKLLSEEKDMYLRIVDILNISRANVLCNMIDENRAKDMLARVNMPNTCDDEKSEITSAADEAKETKEISDSPQEAPVTSEDAPASTSTDIVDVKFLSQVPKFIDPDLKVYGPFEPEDTAEVPVAIANVLLKKGKVEIS